MRDKLIELIGDAPYGLRTLGQAADELISVESIADFLKSHGVTFAEDNNVPCKWVPVGERLPDKSGKYLVRCELWGWGKLFNQWTGLCFFWDETRQFIDDGGPVMGKVTHWMPLPEPPKEGE